MPDPAWLAVGACDPDMVKVELGVEVPLEDDPCEDVTDDVPVGVAVTVMKKYCVWDELCERVRDGDGLCICDGLHEDDEVAVVVCVCVLVTTWLAEAVSEGVKVEGCVCELVTGWL